MTRSNYNMWLIIKIIAGIIAIALIASACTFNAQWRAKNLCSSTIRMINENINMRAGDTIMLGGCKHVLIEKIKE